MDNGLQANTVSARDPSSSAAPAPPVKRRPGRPKGSGKKHLSTPNALEKIKRPVGRPRKDGLPAGSVGPRRSTTRKAAVEKGGAPSASAGPAGMSFAGAFYPQHPGIAGGWQGFTPLGASASASAPPAGISAFSVVPQVDPSLNRDEWAVLARTKPNVFLQSLCATLAAPNPLPTVGPTVEDAFKSHLASLSPPAAKDGNMNPNGAPPLPPLYSVLKTFWLPSSPAYLSLITPGHTAKLLSEHRFLYWDPLPLVFNGIPCPACNAPLINKGRIRTGPLKVYDLERPFFIIGCEYACRSAACVAATSSPEGRRFASVDKSIMQALPTRLKDELPARLLQNDGDMGSGVDVWGWHALGVSKQLWNMVKGCLRAGMGRDAILGVIASVQNPLPEEKQEEEEDAEGESLAASGSGGGGGGVVGNGNGVEVHGNGNGSGAAEGHGASEDATMDAAPGADGGAQPQSYEVSFHDAWRAHGVDASSGDDPGPSSSTPQTSQTLSNISPSQTQNQSNNHNHNHNNQHQNQNPHQSLSPHLPTSASTPVPGQTSTPQPHDGSSTPAPASAGVPAPAQSPHPAPGGMQYAFGQPGNGFVFSYPGTPVPPPPPGPTYAYFTSPLQPHHMASPHPSQPQNQSHSQQGTGAVPSPTLGEQHAHSHPHQQQQQQQQQVSAVTPLKRPFGFGLDAPSSSSASPAGATAMTGVEHAHVMSPQHAHAHPPPYPPPRSLLHPGNAVGAGGTGAGAGAGAGAGGPTTEVAILEPAQKRQRHCCKCGSQECKGKGGRTFCLNACQDCGKRDCRGRNSRRPDKVCAEAWL